MSARIRMTITIAGMLLLALLSLAPRQAVALPLRPEGNNQFGGTPGMHLFLPSRFIDCIREDRLFLARLRHYRDNFNQAVNRGHYTHALEITDTLIHITQHHTMPGVRYNLCYQNRARMLRKLQRDSAACVAFERAMTVKDSLMRFEQDEDIREMQASYELDRLALDRALLKAHHHKTTMIALSLLLVAAITGVGFIYASNRRTKRLQRDLLREMRHARDSEAKKTAFINSMCHEVRTPLNCVAGFSELLGGDDLTDENHDQYCEIIRENRRQLRYLFDDLLEVATLESLQEPLARNYIELCGLCRSQLRVMKVRYPKQGVIYTENIPTNALGILSSEKYLNLLIAALLNNAYKFTQEGHVSIACGRVGDDRIFITVEDTGCGIASAHYEYVFERFTKLDTFSQGNGLGLYLCRLVVRHLGGQIHIDPAYTGGTRVVVTLPRR